MVNLQYTTQQLICFAEVIHVLSFPFWREIFTTLTYVCKRNSKIVSRQPSDWSSILL
jgi:hypothetical protein